MANRTLTLTLAASAVVMGLAASAPVSAAPVQSLLINDVASTSPQLIFGVDRVGQEDLLQKAQWAYGGRHYCFYDFGWHGPGYYWCGYANRRGFGWGGLLGWNGWGRSYGGYRGGYRGGYHVGGYHGGGYHGGGYHGGGSGHVSGGYHGGGQPGGGHVSGGHGGGGSGDHHH